MATECEASGACNTTGQGQGGVGGPSGGCPCGTPGCSGDPIDCAAGMWSGAFMRAMKELQVELLKAKMQKAWGPKLDKAADAAVEAMGAQWQAMLAQAQSKAQFRQKLAGLWQ